MAKAKYKPKSRRVSFINAKAERWVWVICNKKFQYLTAGGKWDDRLQMARIFTRHQDTARALPRWRGIMNDETLYVASLKCLLH